MSGGKSTQDLMLNALKEIKTLKRQLAAYRKAAHEPIAIVGMACRYPGQSINPAAFWDRLYNGVDCITQQDNNERWNMDDLYDPNPDAPGKIYSKGLGIIERPDMFDAEFFGISPREAEDIDPQHRILLEVCHEAMEDAGYAPSRLNGSPTGVFAGLASSDYAHLGSMLGTAEKLTPWQGIGNAASAAPCRISYLYNFKGPALGIDTACSSSLVALHYACQSLRNRECDVALSGGVHLVLNPAVSIVFAKARMLAADGKCKTFDAAADGYVRSEGCGAVMLKRLSDAEADGDNILALIRGSAINQDGKSQGFTAPNETAQEEVIRAALQQAQLEPAQVSYVEAHGTGTPLGDPIELGALNAVYCAGQQRRHPLLVGSAKTNIGHSEAAAGAAGLIKLVLSLKHRTIPPHIHYQTPNPYIPWNKMAIQVTDKLTPWDAFAAPDGKLRAGLSAFAFTGTNAHIVLEEYQPEPKTESPTVDVAVWTPPLVLTSAKQPLAVSLWQDALKTHMDVNPSLTVDQIARTCAAGRDHYKYRTALLPQSVADLQDLLQQKQGERVLSGVRQKPKYKVALVFAGAGDVSPVMARAYYRHVAAFRAHFDQCAQYLQPLLGMDLAQLLRDANADIPETGRAATAFRFAQHYALARMWMQWGVRPDCVTGQGTGEIVAACIAGVFSLADACRLAAGESAANIVFSTPRMRIFSSLNGEHLGKQMATPEYWQQQPAQTVAVAACIDSIRAAQVDVVLALGSGGLLEALKPMARAQDAVLIETASAGENTEAAALQALTLNLAQLYVAGLDLEWADIMPLKAVPPVELPTYQFQRKSFWNETLRAALEQQDLPEKTRHWLYQLQWETATLPEQRVPVSASLVLFPAQSAADDFSARLAQSSASSPVSVSGCFSVEDGRAQIRLGERSEVIAADGAASPLLTRCLHELQQTGAADVRLVVSAAQLPPLHSAQDFDALTALFLSLAKTLKAINGCRLVIITEAAMAIGAQSVLVRTDQAVVLGFAKNLLLEMADRMQSVIDVEQWDDATAHQCAELAVAAEPAPWISIRQQQTLLPAVQRLPADALSRRKTPIAPDAFYVVAGGTGAIGLALAEWLANRGAQHLALLSRSGARSESVRQRIDQLRARGVQVETPALDIADRAALDAVLQTLRSERRIAGVIHAAGQFELCPLNELTTRRCSLLMANKVLGLQWLDELCADDPLDFFAGFSSIASVWGSAGNFHYSAANQAVDAIIERRRQQGKTALAINWGPWADSGMVSTESGAQAARRGLLQLDMNLGLQVFERLLGSDESRAIVADIHWQRFKPLMGMLPVGALFRAVQDVAADGAAVVAPAVAVELNQDDIAFKQELAICPAHERAERLLGYLRQQLARALQLETADIDDTQPLIDMGIDSLLAVEFKNRVTQVTQVELPVVRLLGGANLRDVAKWMAEGYAELHGEQRSTVEDAAEQSDEQTLMEGVL